MINNLTEIRTDQIFPHPDNPRKDIRDISELVESIKKNGVMQNLTVIPGHWQQDGVWSEEGYTALIGHRRLAAAKQAGIETVPCRIEDKLSRKEQICIMLEENMQRDDLTIFEQAQTFQQLTLDFGETETSLAEKTGFSRSTVRHRLQIAKLDKGLLHRRQQDGFQLSLTDMYELERLHDVKARNKILQEARNASEIKWRVENEITNLKREANAEEIKGLLEAMGIRQVPKKDEQKFLWYGEWEELQKFDLLEDPPDEIVIKPKHDGKIAYNVDYRSISVKEKKKEQKHKKTPEEMKFEQQKANTKRIKEILGDMTRDRELFLKKVYSGEFKAPEKLVPGIEKTLWKCIAEFGGYVSLDYIMKAVTGKSTYDLNKEEVQAAKEKTRNTPMHIQMLTAAQRQSEYTELVGYDGDYNTEKGEAFKDFYRVLSQYGYSLTDPEHMAVLNGTSDLYKH